MKDKNIVRNRIIELVNQFDYLQEDKERLLDFLSNSDFYDAPFTTEYQYSYPGGLAEYSLDVCENLKSLVNAYKLNEVYSWQSLCVIGLFHALSKVNYFESYVKNEKVYSPNGTKFDNMGNFDWVSKQAFKVKDAKDRYTAGEMGFTSYMLLSRFIPLTDNEIMAIVHYNCGMDNGHSTKDIFEILKSYPLVALLHSAMMITLNVLYKNE